MPINTKNTFMELVTSYHENPEKFIFFVGAGLSQPLFPSWKSLLENFLEQAKEGELPHEENEILDLIEKGESYLDVAEVCVNAMGTVRYRDVMEKIFDKDFSEDEVPESYRALMELAPKTIITTNYDRIPEIAGRGKYRINTNKNAPEASRFVSDGKNSVFKMHGDIIDQSSIVLTTSDYQKIINGNQSTRLLLSSLLSTKILVFVGFSLSDPHIDVILDNIRSINNGMPLSHYILLNENSSFKISSFARKYGVKVISYTPSDASHPEVTELIRALSHETGQIPEQVKKSENIELSTSDDLVNHLHELAKEAFVNSPFSIFYSNDEIYLSFTPSGETKGEIQKEFLSIIKLMNFDCSILSNLNISAIARTAPSSNFDESQRILIKAKVSFIDANKFAAKEISTSTIWKLIDFYSPLGLSNVFQQEGKVSFPMSIGLVGGQS
ncbi:SIR2 family protein [Colwellia sp. 6_MG-2023]|uniref:SIR2 family protein n=1 Tax=Colwellia sp. 6_MG-2023 TaxID=3062676 RepID=UPI0026E28D46|nr:SIR2 family protein [Colwellia sp. 6_MG-2023]MDO6489400.1 SIR2 family protein [Colwellia sp. 6_MG-2023]